MLALTLFVVSLFLNGIYALPLNDTEQDLDEIRSIVNYLIDNSETDNQNVDENLFEGARVVHNCRKSLGINTTIGRDRSSQGGRTPRDFSFVKNTERENLIPTWSISPSEFDQFYDQARFDRYLTSISDPSFKRRITWLYPDNGMLKEYLFETIIFG